jgi:putative heme transporter
MSADSWERRGPVVAWPVTGAGGKAAPRAVVHSLLRRYARHALSVAVLATAGYFLAAHASDLRAASHLLSGLRWPWILVAVACEAVSMLVFARLQRRLLRAGGVRLGLGTMLGLTVAANAMDATLPGGIAWAATWVFGKLSDRGVPRAQRVWMFLAAGAVSSFALFVVVAAGIEFAGGRGPMAGLRIPALILASIPVAGAAWLLLRRVRWIRSGWQLAWRRLASRSQLARRLQRLLDGFLSRLRAVRLGPGGWADAFAMGLANWLLDAAVLIAVLQALGIAVPWRAILVIYGVTQVAGSLPVTPGGLGIVEGSLAGLLTAYGVGGERALAAVMVYRLVSFWGLVPAGWLVWLHLSFWRRGRAAAPAVNALNGAAEAGKTALAPARAVAAPARPPARRARLDLAGATFAALSGATLLALPGAALWYPAGPVLPLAAAAPHGVRSPPMAPV